MFSTTYPPVVIEKSSNYKGAFLKRVLSILVFGIIAVGIVLFVFESYNNTMTINTMENEQFMIEQFVIEDAIFKEPTAALDFTLLEDFTGYMLQMELQATFYDNNNRRIAMASGLLPQGIRKGQKTTVRLKFDPASNLDDVSSVRVELLFPTMLDI